jgi:hypothetical protein
LVQFHLNWKYYFLDQPKSAYLFLKRRGESKWRVWQLEPALVKQTEIISNVIIILMILSNGK